MKNLKRHKPNVTKQNTFNRLLITSMFLSSIVPVYCVDNGMVDRLTQNQPIKVILQNFLLVVDTNVVPVLLFVFIGAFFFVAHNERALPIYKNALKVVAFALLGIHAVYLITNTLLWIAEKITGQAGYM